MEENPCVTGMSASIRDAAAIMRDHDCGFLPVLTDGEVAG
ncbi:CBS domain-containing protein, partial [Pseudomonas aeruginosa]